MSNGTNGNRELAKIIGEALFLASLSSSLASVEMSSKFSVLNFSKDQKILQRAADALNSYIVIGMIWLIASMFSLWASYGFCGAFIGVCCNIVMLGWLVASYNRAFKQAAKENGLQEPTVFNANEWMIFIIVCIFIVLTLAYAGGYLNIIKSIS